MDPRVKASAADLAQQFDFSKKLEEMRAELEPIGKSYEALVSELKKAEEAAATKGLREKIEALRKKLEAFANPAAVAFRRNPPVGCAEQGEKTVRGFTAGGRRADTSTASCSGGLAANRASGDQAMEGDATGNCSIECTARGGWPSAAVVPSGVRRSREDLVASPI